MWQAFGKEAFFFNQLLYLCLHFRGISLLEILQTAALLEGFNEKRQRYSKEE